MKLKKIIFLIIFTMALIILKGNLVKAAGYDISATSYNVKVGEKVTVNVSFTAAAWNINVSGDKISGGSYASQTDDLSERTTNKSFNLDTSATGSFSVRMSGDITDANGKVTKIDKSITVNVAAAPVDNPQPPATTKSTEARLKNLGITPNDFKGFKRDTTTYSVEVPNGVSKVNVYAQPLDSKAKVSGTGNITLKEGANSVKVTVTAEDGRTQKTYTINITRKAANENTPDGKSTEARLKNLGITPNDFKGFKKDTTTYNVEVPNGVTKVNVYAQSFDSKAKVSGTGDVNLKEGANAVKVTVTAEDGKTQKTYTINITRKSASSDIPEENSSTEARLKSLGIRPKEYDFDEFKEDTTTYNVEVPDEIEEIEIYAEAISAKSKVKGTGKVSLKSGKNEIKVEVTSEDGKNTKTYMINVTRTSSTGTTEPQDNESKNVGLSQLLIKNANISPKFDTETYEYKIDLAKDIDSLEIETKAFNEKSKVEIIGNKGLKEGENIITILVSDSDTDETVTYQIIVNKTIASEVVGKVDWLKPATWGLKEKVIFTVAVVLIVLIIVLIVVKFKLSKKDEDEFDLPGGYELDMALAEHQELSEEDEQEYQQSEETIKSIEEGLYKPKEKIDLYQPEEVANNVEELEGVSQTTAETSNIIEDLYKQKDGVEDVEQYDLDNTYKRKGKHFK